MSTRLSLRRSILLLGALSWIALPVSLYAGPGGGGGHGGGGGGHSGGGHSSGGSHSAGSGHSSGVHSGGSGYGSQPGRNPSGSGAPYSRSASANSASRSGGSNNLSSFVPMQDSSPGSSALNANLSQMAAHGWSFLPSSGITRPAAALRPSARPGVPVRVTNTLGAVPRWPRSRPGWGAYPFNPFFPYGWFGGFGPFGGCFFNGFTNVCGANPFLYGAFSPNYCFSGAGFWNCGYGGFGGYGLGYDAGYGYAPGPDSGYDVNAPSPNGPDDSQNDSEQMVIDANYIGNGTQNPEQNTSGGTPQAPLTQIILKNGSAYAVTAYWVSDGELYYRPVTGGLNHVPVDQLDLAATVQANSRNGVTFQLTDHPRQQ